jgi:hypothetical protein
LDVWDDRKIGAGDAWFDQIQEHMRSAKVAILLISPSFLTSDFILAHEVPKLFDRHAESGMHIYPLLIRPCPWQEVAWLARMQIRPPEAKAAVKLSWREDRRGTCFSSTRSGRHLQVFCSLSIRLAITGRCLTMPCS